MSKRTEEIKKDLKEIVITLSVLAFLFVLPLLIVLVDCYLIDIAPAEMRGSKFYYQDTLYWLCESPHDYEPDEYLGKLRGTGTRIYSVKNDPEHNFLITNAILSDPCFMVKEGVNHTRNHSMFLIK